MSDHITAYTGIHAEPKQLAAVESTQCGEVIFTLLGGMLILHDAIPSGIGFVGLLLVVAGMIANSLVRE